MEERAQLNGDLATKLKGPIGPEIIPWIWSRYHRMGRGLGRDGYLREYGKEALVPLLTDAVGLGRPNAISANSWKRATRMTAIAVDSAIRDAPRDDPARLLHPDEVDRFFDAQEKLLGQGPGLKRLLNVWTCLAESGPHGKQYVDRERPALLEVLGNPTP
jgi:hypothetical protein